MSTDLNARSKAYDLTRVSTGHGIAVVVGKRISGCASLQLDTDDITEMFRTDDFSSVQNGLDLLDETMDRLKVDLAQFCLSGGNGMEAY